MLLYILLSFKYTSAKDMIEIDGARSEGGNGSVVQNANLFKADSIEIATVKFKNKPVLYSHTGVENIIGNPIIKYFIVTLNFKDNDLYLSPMPESGLTDGWNSFGYRAEYKNNKVVVTSLFKGLSADKAGLKMDDEIVSINGQALACKNYCDCMATLTRLFDENTRLVLGIKSRTATKEIIVAKDKVY